MSLLTRHIRRAQGLRSISMCANPVTHHEFKRAFDPPTSNYSVVLERLANGRQAVGNIFTHRLPYDQSIDVVNRTDRVLWNSLQAFREYEYPKLKPMITYISEVNSTTYMSSLDRLETVLWAALLHDVGNVSEIPKT